MADAKVKAEEIISSAKEKALEEVAKMLEEADLHGAELTKSFVKKAEDKKEDLKSAAKANQEDAVKSVIKMLTE